MKLPDELHNHIETLARLVLKEEIGHRDLLAFDQPDPVKALIDGVIPLIDDDLRQNLRGSAITFCRGNSEISDAEFAMAIIDRCLSVVELRIASELYISNEFQDSLLLQKFPELRAELNDEGLISSSMFKSKRKLVDAFIYKGHALYLSEAIPSLLQEELIDIVNTGKFPQIYLRLSHYKLVPLKKYREPLEKARDRGPSFSEKHVREKFHKENITTVLTRRCNEEDVGLYGMCGFAPFERLEINRNERAEKKDTLVSFFAELLNRASANQEYVWNWIFHSDFYLKDEDVRFKHADATLLVYKGHTYQKRLSKKAPDTEKAEGHFKLFWIADCPLETWLKLFHKTFPRTELVGEYFSGQTFDPRKQLGLPPEFKLSDGT